MNSDPSKDQSHIVREEEDFSASGGFLSHFLTKIGYWLSFFWESLTRMLTTRPMMMMLSSPSVVDHTRSALSAIDQLEGFRIPDKTRIHSSCLEISSGIHNEGEEDFKTTGLIGNSFPPHIPQAHFNHACGFLQGPTTGSYQSFIQTHKYHSESDLKYLRIMGQRETDNDFQKLCEDHYDKEELEEQEETPDLAMAPSEEEGLFTMDEDGPSIEAFIFNDNCVITDNDVSKFLSGLQEEKTFGDTRSWDEDSNSSIHSSSTTSPIDVVGDSSKPKFKCSLSTIIASPLVSSLLGNPAISTVDNEQEELTALQKKILEDHPPTKPNAKIPEKKFLEVKDNKGGKLRRATSLKIYTSPEQKTDTHKKIVRFADVLGLDLESTKTYNHGIPTVPKSAYLYLRDVELSDSESETSSRGIGGCSSFFSSRPTRSITPPTGFTRSPEQIVAKSGLAPQFTQPGIKEDFVPLVNSQSLSLECAYVSVNGSTLSGVVAVKNISFHKQVLIRYTINDWHTSTDSEATYSSSCPQNGFDKFAFDIYFDSPISLSQRLQFCIKYSTQHGEFWDNNCGANYIFKSLTKFDKMSSAISQSRIKPQTIISQSPSCSEDPWHHFV